MMITGYEIANRLTVLLYNLVTLNPGQCISLRDVATISLYFYRLLEHGSPVTVRLFIWTRLTVYGRLLI